MMIFGIVSEYNPMHNGHVYQIKRIKKHFPDAYVISLTSSSFVQRGEPSFISKHSKSLLALENGVDLVLEMPTIVSIQSANYFSFYSIYLLNKLNILSHLSFGVENLNKKTIDYYVDFTNKYKKDLEYKTLEYMKRGFSYKVANIRAYQELNFKNLEILDKPNNTLALQYAISLDILHSNIDLFPINRTDKGYHEEKIDESAFQSASSIRKAFKENKDIDSYTPPNMKKYQQDLNTVDIDAFSKIFYYKAFIEETSPNEIASYENGLLNLLKSNFEKNISDMIDKSHNKRYSKSRLRRFVLNYLLDIKSEDVKNLDKINYVRPLAFNEKGRDLLKIIKEKSDLIIINKINKIDKLDSINKRFIDIEQKAFKLYNIYDIKKNRLDHVFNPYIKKTGV